MLAPATAVPKLTSAVCIRLFKEGRAKVIKTPNQPMFEDSGKNAGPAPGKPPPPPPPPATTTAGPALPPPPPYDV